MRGDRPGEPIRWRMHIGATPEQVFAALDSDEGRAAFWAETATETDSIIDFRFINGYEHKSKILRREPPGVFEIAYFGGAVRFELACDGDGGTDLLLTHDYSDIESWGEVHAGWLNVLFPLKAWLQHGIDLRNHDRQRSWNEGYADQ
ncbi:MAG: hypothetical protein HKM98_11040 [Gammaproteobacteria bacterium]|nr:hypothetical protein [Gammaproteobacteria bacterium]